jgi:hypothetical protein
MVISISTGTGWNGTPSLTVVFLSDIYIYIYFFFDLLVFFKDWIRTWKWDRLVEEWLKFHARSYGIWWDLMGYTYLVRGLEHLDYFSIQLGMSSSQLTFTYIIFFRGVSSNHQPDAQRDQDMGWQNEFGAWAFQVGKSRMALFFALTTFLWPGDGIRCYFNIL